MLAAASRVSRYRIVLLLLLLIVFSQVGQFSFVNYDDNSYVTDNANVQEGFTWSSLTWAATCDTLGHWHPLTWLSHMLDCQLFGSWAGGHHAISAGLHIANTFLVFWLVLQCFSNRPGLAFVIAALWSLHPLRVESVAWVSERKDVLSSLFFLATVNLYIYSHTTKKIRQWVLVFLFALGLLSKSMVITLPAILLLVDYWPLNRFHVSFKTLVLEKMPFFLLAMLSAIITLRTPAEVHDIAEIPYWICFQNAVISYGVYLKQLVLPFGLTTAYPDQLFYRPVCLLVTVVILSTISLLAWRNRAKYPAILIGWLWFLIVTLPPSGFIKITSCPHSDRYTYLAHIGLFLVLACLIKNVLITRLHMAVAFTAVLASSVLCIKQLNTWKDSTSLWEHAIACNPNNHIAHNNLGVCKAMSGDLPGALLEFKASVQAKESYSSAHNNIGLVYFQESKWPEAMVEFKKAVALDPLNDDSKHNINKTELQMQIAKTKAGTP